MYVPATVAYRLTWNARENRYMLARVSMKERIAILASGEDVQLYYSKRQGCAAVVDATRTRQRMMSK